LSAIQIAHALEIPIRLVQQLLHELSDVGLVVETTKGVRNEAAFQPGRDIEGITIKYALDRYEEHGVTHIPASQSEEAEKISMYLKKISEIIEQSSVNILLKEI
jgi:membrane protein